MGSYGRDRALVAWGLKGLFGDLAAPPGARRLGPVSKVEAPATRVPWLEVTERWAEAVAHLRGARVPGAEVLAALGPGDVERQGRRLVVRLRSPALAEWFETEGVRRQLWAGLGGVVDVPADGAMAVEVAAPERERALGAAIKLQRRHDDLVSGRPETEGDADRKLASGYVLPEPSPRSRPTEA